MDPLEIKANIGDKEIIVYLTQSMGGGSIYYIMIEGMFHGQVVKSLGEWDVFLNGNSYLSIDDKEMILQAVIKSNGLTI